MSFEENVKKWVAIDDEIKKVSETLKTLRESKNTLNNIITKHVTNNNMHNSQVTIGDGRLKFTTTKIQQPLTFTYLEKGLGEIIKDKTHATVVLNHIKNQRECKIVHDIKRFYNN